jgi:uncharacterized protein (DUF2141 family)
MENIKKELIITPMTDLEYEFKYKKNSIEITFLNPLEDSTTYTFNFQSAIKDITEGNISSENTFTFSTGTFIDSIYITGSVSELLTNQPLKDITVGLYSVNDTFNLFKGRPMYFTKSDNAGKFRIDNIRISKYFIQAFRDLNENLVCDLPREPHGFRLDTLDLKSNIDSIRVATQNLDIRELTVQKALPSGKYFEITFNKTITEYSLNPLDTGKSVFCNLIENGKGIRFYNTIRADSAGVFLSAIDSVNNILADTFFIKFQDTKRDPEPFDVKIDPPDKSNIELDFHADIIFSKPVRFIDADSIYIRYDSANIDSIRPESNILLNEFSSTLSISKRLNKDLMTAEKAGETITASAGKLQQKALTGNTKASQGMKLYFGRGAFISIENDSSSQLILNYSLRNQEDFGIIKGSVTTSHQSYTVQLLNKGSQVISELNSIEHYSFTNISPGEYVVRVLVDNNGDGKWDPGNFSKNRMPEDVYFYPGILTLRANWELQDINFTF